MQVLALVYLPIGLYRGLRADDVRTEMMFLAVGALLFLWGRWLQTRHVRG